MGFRINFLSSAEEAAEEKIVRNDLLGVEDAYEYKVYYPFPCNHFNLVPRNVPGALGASLPGKALKEGLWALETLDIRSFASDKHASVDDTPYGGGAGMVMRPDVVDAAIRGAAAKFGKPARKIYLSPRGRVLDQALVKELSREPSLLLLCGRYEGVDQRVIDAQGLEEISLGDFILAGGEIAAMLALLEACVRLLPGVVGNDATHERRKFRERACWNIRTTRARRCGTEWKCRRFWFPATTRKVTGLAAGKGGRD